jgi:hypothetical protein
VRPAVVVRVDHVTVAVVLTSQRGVIQRRRHYCRF